MQLEIRRIKRGWMNLEVIRIERETHDCVTLYFIDQEERTRAFDYVAGQYLTFRFDNLSAKPVVRSYTMSSSPCQHDDIAVTVKEVEAGFISHYLCRDVKVGDILRARGAIGKFVYDAKHDHRNLVMVAAGSGVTPFVSIMREYAARLGEPGCPASMTLLVAYRSRADLLCWPTLEALNKVKGVKVLTTLSREDAREHGFLQGRICPELIDLATDGQYEATTFMTCGPDDMMKLTAEHVLSRQVPSDHMKMESFSS